MTVGATVARAGRRGSNPVPSFLEVTFKIVLTIGFTAFWLIALHWTWTKHLDLAARGGM